MPTMALSSTDLVVQHDIGTRAYRWVLPCRRQSNNVVDQASSLAVTPDGRDDGGFEFASQRIGSSRRLRGVQADKYVSMLNEFTGPFMVNLSILLRN